MKGRTKGALAIAFLMVVSLGVPVGACSPLGSVAILLSLGRWRPLG